MTTKEHIAEHDREIAEIRQLLKENAAAHERDVAEIRQMLKTLAVTVVQHDNQIEALIKQWQAYVNTLPRQ